MKRRRSLQAPDGHPAVTAAVQQHVGHGLRDAQDGPLAVDVVEAGLLEDVVHGLPRPLQLGGVADGEVHDVPAERRPRSRAAPASRMRSLPQATAAARLLRISTRLRAVVAVVPLPAVGPDAEDVALLALRHEAELVGDEVVGLRDGVAHERLALERLAGVGDEVLLRKLGLQGADHGLDAVGAGGVAVYLEGSRRGARLIGHRHKTPSVAVVAPLPHVRRTSRSVASSVGALSPRKAVTSSHTPSSVSRTAWLRHRSSECSRRSRPYSEPSGSRASVRPSV